MKKAVCIFLMLLFLLAGCASTGKKVERIDKKDTMYSMIYDYDNNPVQEVKIYINGKYAGESDVQGRFLVSGSPGKDIIVKLEKSSYEALSAEIHFDPLKVAYFKMGNCEQFRKLSENSLFVHENNEALEYCLRAEKLESTRQDIQYLKAVILNQLERFDESNAVLGTMTGNDNYSLYIRTLKVKNENHQK
jgi:hypothetical protein